MTRNDERSWLIFFSAPLRKEECGDYQIGRSGTILSSSLVQRGFFVPMPGYRGNQVLRLPGSIAIDTHTICVSIRHLDQSNELIPASLIDRVEEHSITKTIFK